MVLIINFKMNSNCTFFKDNKIYTLDCLPFILIFSLFCFFVYLIWNYFNDVIFSLLNNSISISLVTITSIYFVFECPGDILQSYFSNFIIGVKCKKCVSRKLHNIFVLYWSILFVLLRYDIYSKISPKWWDSFLLFPI